MIYEKITLSNGCVIEAPQGTTQVVKNGCNLLFWKDEDESFVIGIGWVVCNGQLLTFKERLIKRPDNIVLLNIKTPQKPDHSEKLKYIEKWLNGEDIQYQIGFSSEYTQWHNLTNGALQYFKRSDIRFREKPKELVINGVKFETTEKLLKYVRNHYDIKG